MNSLASRKKAPFLAERKKTGSQAHLPSVRDSKRKDCEEAERIIALNEKGGGVYPKGQTGKKLVREGTVNRKRVCKLG